MKISSSTGIALAAFAASSTAASNKCRVLPGDAKWPDAATWASLNSTVQGRLIATVPIGHVCHDPTYDAAACAALQETWAQPMTQSVLTPVSLFHEPGYVHVLDSADRTPAAWSRPCLSCSLSLPTRAVTPSRHSRRHANSATTCNMPSTSPALPTSRPPSSLPERTTSVLLCATRAMSMCIFHLSL